MQTGILFRGETRILDDEARRSAPGDFVRLPDGMVHYELKGPPDGQPVVLVHGFSVPYYIWDPTFPALAAAGLRVLRYDLFGRGFSDRPDLPYTMELFVRQLKDLLEALQVNIPVSLVGLSMGGPVSAGFTVQHPEFVRKLCLLDPAGFQNGRPILYRLISLPGLGETLIGLFANRLLASNQPGDFYMPEKFPGYPEQFLPQMQYRVSNAPFYLPCGLAHWAGSLRLTRVSQRRGCQSCWSGAGRISSCRSGSAKKPAKSCPRPSSTPSIRRVISPIMRSPSWSIRC